MKPLHPVVADLARVRDFLSDENRWTKYNFTDHEGRRCIVGAIGRYATNRPYASVYAISQELMKRNKRAPNRYKKLPFPQGIIATFNDRKCRTHADILALLDDTIASVMEYAAKREKHNAR